jgi:AcrR family transcriptional regulator
MAAVRGGTAKQDAIVAAATRLFSHYGYRKTTVDLIAHEAEVAKPTLYAHFGDKEAIFVAVCQHVVDGILATAETELEHDDVVDRIAGVVSAKFTRVFELIDSSPHARELLESQDAQAKEVVAKADVAFSKLLTEALRSAFRRGELVAERTEPRPAKLAQLLLQAGHGAGYGARSVDEHRANLRALVAALLGRPG